MLRFKKHSNFSSTEDIQYFRQALVSALTKLNDSSTKQLGLDEIDNILSEHAQSTEHISLVLNVLSENDEHQKISARRETIKILGIMAKVFEDKILDFLPKILSLITKKLKENNPQLHDSLSDAIGSIMGFGLRNLEPSEACKYINTSLRTFLSLCESSNKYTQIGAAMCISKILQCSRVECLHIIADDIAKGITDILRMSTCKAHLQLFEAILGLILGIEDNLSKLQANSRVFFPVIIDNLANSDWNVRKIAVEAIYTLSFLLKEAIVPRKKEILAALNDCKTDKIRNVREITLTTINFLKEIQDPLPTDSEEVSASPGLEKQVNKEGTKNKEGIVYVSFGKSDPTLKTMMQKLERPGGDLVNFEKVKIDENPQQKSTSSKSKSGLDKNPNFFSNGYKKIGDVEIYTKNDNSKDFERLNTSKNEHRKSPVKMSKVHENGKDSSSTKKLEKVRPDFEKSHPIVADFFYENNAEKGIKISSAEKKSRMQEESVHSHRRQQSEQEVYGPNTKLFLAQKTKIEGGSNKREHMESSSKNVKQFEIQDTPIRGEKLSGDQTKQPDSGSLGSAQGFIAEDFANLTKQLKKICKQQTQLIESVTSFETTTQKEINLIKTRLGYLEDFVQKVLPLTYQYTPFQNQYSSISPYSYSSYHPNTYPHQYYSGEGYSLDPTQNMDLQDDRMRKSHSQNFNSMNKSYNNKIYQGTFEQREKYQSFDQKLKENTGKDNKGTYTNQVKSENFDENKQLNNKNYKKNDNLPKNDVWTTKTRKNSTWSKIEELLKKGLVNEAYTFCVAQNDEENTVKLMKETGIIVHLLDEETIGEIIRITEKKMFEQKDRNLILDWIEQVIRAKSLAKANELLRINQVLAQALVGRNLTKEEYQRIGKLKSELGVLLNQDEEISR